MDHNNLIDFGADMLSKIVNDVETEPELQQITGEITDDSKTLQDPTLD